jgi:hypothetical protein
MEKFGSGTQIKHTGSAALKEIITNMHERALCEGWRLLLEHGFLIETYKEVF